MKNIKKSIKIKNKNPILLKGASLDEQNAYIKQLLESASIDADIKFKPEELQEYVTSEKSFGKGVLAYLKILESELKVLNNPDLEKKILQILSELGSLVFPNSSACYSLIPGDLKKLNWESIVDELNKDLKKKMINNEDDVSRIIALFVSNKHPQTVTCLVSLSLCKVLIRPINKPLKGLLVDDNGEYVGNNLDIRPRVKAGDWLNTLRWDIEMHLIGLNSKKFDTKQQALVSEYSAELARSITEELIKKGLLASYKTVEKSIEKVDKVKTPRYFIWNATNFLIFPKVFSLPMVVPPNDWIINDNHGANNGGYLLSELTNISYQGFLDSKSSRTHEHRLKIQKLDHINKLQKVKFSINNPIVSFYKRYTEELTDTGRVLLDDRWLQPTPEMCLEITRTHSNILTNPDQIREAVDKELESKRNETLRNQEALAIATLYCNKAVYWPAVQDFRGRIYRLGNLNIQSSEFVRSLTALYSDNKPVNRKKNKYTEQQFNLLLEHILEKKDLIKKWDDIFGNRFIDNETFEQLLLKSLLAEEISLIQVGQLLLVRQGAYDKVGVYYDASASAYQIMGIINNDKQLCELTNVLLSDEKRDMYSFFLERIKANCDSYVIKDKRESLETLYNNYFQTNIDRKLIKAIVMPLIYGKTGQGFASDLEEFFAKENLYPKEVALIILASQIIKTLKNDPVFANVNLFMKALRAIGAFMFEFDDFSIKGYYNDSRIVYYKEDVEEIRIYYKQKGKKYKSQKIYLSKPARDVFGCLIKSKTKSVNAFVANYIHFLDASICHYVVDNFSNKRTFKMGTIHDCFLVKPTEIPILRDAYSDGLRWVYQIHIYNLLNWCYKICEYYKNKSHLKKKFLEQELQEIKVFLDDSERFINNRKTEVNISCLTNIKNVLLNIIPRASASEKQRIRTIIDYIDKIYLVDSPLLVDTDFGQLLFSDNS